jgi:hypothetical protein
VKTAAGYNDKVEQNLRRAQAVIRAAEAASLVVQQLGDARANGVGEDRHRSIISP